MTKAPQPYKPHYNPNPLVEKWARQALRKNKPPAKMTKREFLESWLRANMNFTETELAELMKRYDECPQVPAKKEVV